MADHSVVIPFLVKTDRRLTEYEEQALGAEPPTFQLPYRFQNSNVHTDAYQFSYQDMRPYPLLFDREIDIEETLCYTTLKRLRFFFDQEKNPDIRNSDRERLAPPAAKRITNIMNAMHGYPHPMLLTVKYVADNNGLSAPRAYGSVGSNEIVRPGRRVGSIGTMPKMVMHTVFAKMHYITVEVNNMQVRIVHVLSRLFGVDNTATGQFLANTGSILATLRAYWHCPAITPADLDHLIAVLLQGKRVSQWVETLKKGYSSDEFTDGMASFSTSKKTVQYVNQSEPAFVKALSKQYKELTVALKPHITDVADKIRAKGDTPDMVTRKSFQAFCQCIATFIINTGLEHCTEMDPPIADQNKFVLHTRGFSFFPLRDLDAFELEGILGDINTSVCQACGTAFQAIQFDLVDYDSVVNECLDDTFELWNGALFLNEQPGRIYMGEGSLTEMHFRDEAIQYSNSYQAMREWFERTHIYAVDVSTYFRVERNRNGSIVTLERYNGGELRSKYEGLTFLQIKRKSDGTEVEETESFIKRYVQDNMKKVYMNSGDHPPPAKVPADTFNTWIVSPFHDCVITPGKDRPEILQRFLDQISAACSECEVSIKIQLVFLADMIQRPGVKPGIALVYHGGEGTGKSFLGQYFMALIGKNRSTSARASDALSGFNSILRNMLLVVFDEIQTGGSNCGKDANPEYANQLKSVITDQTLSINEKHRKQVQVRSYHRIVITTNEPVVMESQRRPVYMKSNLSLKVNAALSEQLYNDMEDQEGLAFVYNFFQKFNISQTGIDIHKPPANAYNREIAAARDPTLLFMRHLVEGKFRGHTEFFVTVVEIHSLYITWADDENNKRKTFPSPHDTDQQINKHSWTMSNAENAAIGPIEGEGVRRGRRYVREKIIQILDILC